MSALLRAVLGLIVETAVWCAVVAIVALVVAIPLVIGSGARNRIALLVHAVIGAALAVGIAARAGFPDLWQVGLEARKVAVVWAAAGALITAAAEAVLKRRRRHADQPV